MQMVPEFIKGFIFHCQYEKNLSEKTLKAYRIDLRQFTEFLDSQHPGIRIDLVDKQVLRDYIKIISAGKKPKTIKRKLATLKAFFNYLEFEDTIIVNPFRKIRISIKEGKQLPKTITRHNIVNLFTSVYAQKKAERHNGRSPRCALIRDISILELLFSAGIRVAELCCLRKEDVNLQRGCVKIMGKGSRERLVPLCGKEVTRALAEYAALFLVEIESSGWFFVNQCGRRFSEQSVRFMIKKYVKGANMSERITPHMFRHTVATQLLENGVDIRYIQTFLGHSTITTTQIYAQVTEEFQRKTLEKKHPRRDFGVMGGMKDN